MNKAAPVLEACSHCGSARVSSDYVLVRKSEFEALSNGILQPPDKRKRPKYQVDKDAELCEFLLAHESTHTLDETVALAKKKFGETRTPSRSALSRFYKRQWIKLQTQTG